MPVGALAIANGDDITFRAFVGSEEWGIIRETIQVSKDTISNTVHQLALQFKISIDSKNTQKDMQ
jgi:hypothetical protein